MPLSDEELKDILLIEAGAGIDPDARDEATQRADSLWDYWTGLKGSGRARDLAFKRNILELLLGSVQHKFDLQTEGRTESWSQQAKTLMARIAAVDAELRRSSGIVSVAPRRAGTIATLDEFGG